MWIMLAASTVTGVAVANGRSALLPFTFLVLLAYVVAQRSGARPAVIAGSAALPAIAIVVFFGSTTLADAWLFHAVALLTLLGVTWLVARRARLVAS